MMSRSSFRCLLLTVLVLGAFVSIPVQAAQKDDAKAPSKQKLRLVIDYGDGVQKHFVGLPWREGMTVLDLLVAARRHPRGIDVTYRGKGLTAFLTRIDELKNTGAEKNWIYLVNGKLATRGFGIFQIKKTDTVLWRFGEYR